MIFLFLDSLSLAATSGNLNYLAHGISGRGNSVPRCCVGQDKLCHTHRRLRVNPKRPSPDRTNLHFLLVLGFGPSKVDCHSRAIDIAIFFLEPVVLHWSNGNIEGGRLAAKAQMQISSVRGGWFVKNKLSCQPVTQR